jgi:hypothetical protein
LPFSRTSSSTPSIGERSDILDAEDMESLYEDIGFESFDNGSHKRFETEAAKTVQRTVDDEMGMRPAPKAGTVAY